ncbi:MYB DNA-binding domain-containing protein [Histoplasma ohiense]|nr:MYB DNA-binding domain-containing protein [Histoplasma ohiense (nom. inval.)]
MDPLTGMYTTTIADDPFSQLRDFPQPKALRIPPLRDPLPSRSLKVPSPLEPNAGGTRETTSISKTSLIGGNPPAKLPTLEDFLHAARTNSACDTTFGKASSSDPPPKTILPTFINLRAIEKLPYASFDEDIPRKHRRVDLNGDVFGEHLQLPIPKNQKEIPKRPPFGPLTILNGLNEPPPNAALFPPIEPNATPTILTRPTRDTSDPPGIPLGGATKERRGRRINDIIELGIEESVEDIEESFGEDGSHLTLPEHVSKETIEEIDKEYQSPQPQTRPRKKLRKWTEEETRDLLRGVVKCGVGNWTAILSQPELHFNQRTAANLKDRFRVCCPWAYGSEQNTIKEVKTSLADASNGPDASSSAKILLPGPGISRNKQELDAASTANILKPTDQNSNVGQSPPKSPPAIPSMDGPSNLASDPKLTSKKSRVSASKTNPSLSSKSKSTLISLGLEEPCLSIKSNRRSRRPFTPAEDDALLKGHAVHGFQWTLIRQDKRLNLMHRKATDLRDRFRTKFPNVYREGGSINAKNANVVEQSFIGSNDSSATEPPTAHDRDTSTISMLLSGNILKTTSNRVQSDVADAGPGKRCSYQTPSNDTCPMNATDPIMLPPPPPALPDLPSVTNSSLFSLQMDDVGSGSVDDSSWGDNTLPPLVWDELT